MGCCRRAVYVVVCKNCGEMVDGEHEEILTPDIETWMWLAAAFLAGGLAVIIVMLGKFFYGW